jgi:hypothetical protein
MKAPMGKASWISSQPADFTSARPLFISKRSARVASWGSAGPRTAAIWHSGPVRRVSRGGSALLLADFPSFCLPASGGALSIHGILPTQELELKPQGKCRIPPSPFSQ